MTVTLLWGHRVPSVPLALPWLRKAPSPNQQRALTAPEQMGEIFAKQRLYFQGNPLTFCLENRNDSSCAGGRAAVGRKFSCHGLSAFAAAALGAGAAFAGRYHPCFTIGSDSNPSAASRCACSILGVPQLDWGGVLAEDGIGGSLRSVQPVLDFFQGWTIPSCCSHTCSPAQHSKNLRVLLLGYKTHCNITYNS